jgi:hypothetical protein
MEGVALEEEPEVRVELKDRVIGNLLKAPL